MKKEFLYVLGFAFIVCFSLDGCSTKVLQVEGKAKSGSFGFFWNAEGSKKFCNFMEENLAETMQTGKEKSFTVPLPEDQKNPVIQICQDGKLLVNQTGKLKHFVIRDPHGKTIMNMSQNQEELDSGSLEEDIKRRVEKLQVGESITAVFFDDSKLRVTFDQIITLVSKDGSNHPARWSQVLDSWLISGAMSHDFQEQSERKIELELTGKEIKRFLDFVTSNKEERKKLLSGLTIFDHIVSVANIHMHYFSKKLFSVCWDDLLKRVRDLLEKGDVSWFEKSFSLENDRGKNIQPFIENLLKRIIAPVLLEKEGVREAEFTLDGTRAIVWHYGNRAEIIDIESEEIIFTRGNVKSMEVTSDGTRTIVEYFSNRAEIIDIESEETIFTRGNVKSMEVTSDGSKAIVKYWNGRAEIIDIESKETIFTRDNFKRIRVTTDGTRTIVEYFSNRAEIIDIESEETIFTRSNVKSMEVISDGSKTIVHYLNNRAEIIDIESEKTILTRNGVFNMKVTADETRALVRYYGPYNEAEIIEIESKKPIFRRYNVKKIEVTADGTRAIVKYLNNRAEIIEIKTGETILKRDNVKSMKVTADGSKVIVLCWDNKLKILDLEDYDRGIDFVKFTPKQLLFVFNLSQEDPDYFAQDNNNARAIWQSFEPEVQKKLKESYFPAIDFR